MLELKPCPFCGGEAKVIRDGSWTDQSPIYAVICLKCKAQTYWFDTEQEAIEAWNTRSTPIPDTPEMVMALDDAYEAGRKSAERTCIVEDETYDDLLEIFTTTLSCGHYVNDLARYIEYCPHCGAKVVGD